jgi:putative transposase
MPWKIAYVVGERWRLVRALLRDEKSVRVCCRLWGVSRKTIYKWRQRFLEGGRRALRDRSRRAWRVARRLKGCWVERIRRCRKKHRRWGPKKIRAQLQTRGRGVPSVRRIGRWLKRLKLAQRPRRRPRKACICRHAGLSVARQANQVWTVDFKGWFRTGKGQRCEPLTVRDLFSRYGVLARLLPTQQHGPVKAVFTRLFRNRGLPEVIRVDTGGPFASKGPGGLSRLSAWWVRLGIRVELTRPGCPQDNGAHEQFHRVLKRETTGPATWTRGGQQHRTTVWLRYYNQHRPHEALGQRMPGQIYRRSRRRFPRVLPQIEYGAGDPVRQVRSNGEIRWAGRKRFVGEALVGQSVCLRRIGPGVWAVYCCHRLIGHLHERDAGAMRPALYKQAKRKKQKL